MIVPDFWAEYRATSRTGGRQVTVRRFGWSMANEAEALAMARERAEEAIGRILGGERLARREPKVPYNGADGMPIREEVLSRHGDEVITRNSYGAHCLNTPRTLFADVDFDSPHSGVDKAIVLFLITAFFATLVGIRLGIWKTSLACFGISVLYAKWIANRARRNAIRRRALEETSRLDRIRKFFEESSSWSARVYRTPSGYRVLATHRPFEPSDPEVSRLFRAIQTDPTYIRMCMNQQCFRARVTAKPWRIGMEGHIRPHRGVWPVGEEYREVRSRWISEYEGRAAGFAACRYLETLGSGGIHETLRNVVELHDRESRALIPEMPIA